MKPKSRLFISPATMVGAIVVMSSAYAADGTWNGISGNWSDTTDPNGVWASGIPADGADFTAFFTGANIAADRTITLDADRTIGNITFTDATTSSNNLTISGSGILTLDRTAPSIPVIDVTQSGRQLAISSQISGSDGLQKSGVGNLRLTGTNDFTGDVIIADGRLIVSTDAALGDATNGITFTGTQGALLLPTGTFTLDSNRTITAQNGAMAVIARENLNNTGTINIAGQLTGEGGFQFSNGYQLGGVTYNLSNADNDFQGVLRIGGDYSGALQFTPSTVTLDMASLADGDGYGNIQFGRGNNSSSNTLILNYTNAAASNLELDNRRIELASNVETAVLSNSSTTYGFIVNTDLLVSRSGNKTLRLTAASGSNNNVFAGDIADGDGAVIAIEKTSSGTWALGGTNTYSGRTTLAQANPATGGITFQGMQALSENTNLYQRHGGGTGGHGTWKFLDDAATPESRSMVNILHVQRNGSQNAVSIFVGNNSTGNGGISSSTQTGSTIQLGKVTFQQDTTGAGSGSRLNLTGANEYRLQLAGIDIDLEAAYTGTWNVRLDPISAALTVAGNVQQTEGSLGKTNLQLDGDVGGNIISGNILDSADVIPQALSVTKEGVNSWTLSGNNNYRGNTTITSGTLEIGGAGTLGHVSSGLGEYAGNISIASTNSGSFVYNSSATQTLSGVISGSGALAVSNGTLILTGDNTHNGETNVNGGSLIVGLNGNGSTATGSLVTVASGATLGGSGTVGGATNIQNGGFLKPGNSPGVLKFTSTLTLAGASTTTMEIDGISRGTGYDGVDVGGTLTYGGSFIIDVADTFGAGDYTFNLFDFSEDSGEFAAISLNGAYGGSFSDGGEGIWTFSGTNQDSWSFDHSTGNLSLTVIPEPDSVLLGAIGFFALMRRRRK